ncbi:FAD-dependent oxidoreductase [Puniceicoccaceae bacterium K14]|nr:FAD-dependent oxidoreductase [Puniceicoccaceae bacterium K14]
MTSHKFCQLLIERKLNKAYEILVYGEEQQVAYDRVHLTDYIHSKDVKQIALSDANWYQDNQIQLISGVRISGIEPDKKSLKLENGTSQAYDKLVLATGSYPFIPPVEGTDSKGVFVYRTIEDAQKIRDYSASKSHAVTLGGGLLGLEAANALKELGLETHVVEFANGLMPRQLNDDASKALESQIASKGLTVHLGKGLKSVLEFGDGLLLQFSDGSEMKTGMLVLSTGVRPRDELANDAGLTVGARGGIVVNDQLQTSDPNIYAIGECAMHRGQVYGFVSPCYSMAETLAETLVNKAASYEGSDLSCRLKLLGVEVSAFGENLGEGKRVVYKANGIYRMMLLKSDRIVGAIVVGDWNQTHHLQLATTENRFFSPIEQNRFIKTGTIDEPDSLQEWPNHAIVCNCMQVNKGQLMACMEKGCSKLEQITDQTGAGSVCGSCRPLIASLTGETGEQAIYIPKGRKTLLGAALLGVVICCILYFLAPLPPSRSVQDTYHSIVQIWNDSLYKQITGYTMAGLSALALLLSARKRTKRLGKSNFGFWRAAHSILGTTCLLALILHTGLSFGENLNAWLMICFVAMNTAGGFAGLTLAMEQKLTGPLSRRLRSFVVKLHILLFWPYPALLGFHIYKVYAY